MPRSGNVSPSIAGQRDLLQRVAPQGSPGQRADAGADSANGSRAAVSLIGVETAVVRRTSSVATTPLSREAATEVADLGDGMDEDFGISGQRQCLPPEPSMSLLRR